MPGPDAIYALLRDGEWRAARGACLRLLAVSDDARVRHALGLACCGTGEYGEAVAHLEQAVVLDPATLRWARDAAAVQAALGRWHDALQMLTPWFDQFEPRDTLLYLTAAAETASTAAVEAVAARSASPGFDSPDVMVVWATALGAVGRHAEALQVLDSVGHQTSDLAAAHQVAANALEYLGDPDAALCRWQQRAQLLPTNARAQLRVSLALQNRGRADESRHARQQATDLGLANAEDRSTCLYLMLADPEVTPEAFRRAAVQVFNGIATAVPAIPGHRSNGPRTRVGYISAEFRSTPSYYFTTSFLAAHDRSRVETFLYNLCPNDDGTTSVYATLGEHWRHLGRATPPEVRDVILRDDLDVLVDLSGHFPYNRLTLLCEHLAPVQASYPHFPGTTGCPGMDVLFTDVWTSPAGTDGEYAERLCRLPPGYLAFTPSEDLPPLSARREARPLFGILQRLAKFHGAVWDALAAVLMAVPDADLLVHNGDAALDQPDSPSCQWIRRQFSGRGIDPARIRLRGPLPVRAHLELVGSLDVTLDTFPYAGQTTTCESLLMGIPVVAFTQRTHVSRVAAALLMRAGHPEWVTHSLQGYVQAATTAVAWARFLSQTRKQLRSEFVDAGLTDGRQLARALENAYQELPRC